VLARAGKALEARSVLSCNLSCVLSSTLQAAANTAVSGLDGAAGSCKVQPGSPAHTAATSNGVFIPTSIDKPF
jgi:hypothetical protein